MEDQLRNLLPLGLACPGACREFLASALALMPLLPLLGFLINALGGRRLPRAVSGAVACAAAGLSFLWAAASCFALLGGPDGAGALRADYGAWIEVGGLICRFGLYFDFLAAVMCLVVTGVGAVIHFYSLGYMADDPGYRRYFAYLNLFLAAMLLLVLGDNLVLMFVGWEGVGLCSYLLIGFWYEDAAKAAAGMKAFVFNRIGDLGFVLGIFTLFVVFGTVDFTGRVVPPEQAERLLPLPQGARYALVPRRQAGVVELRLIREPGLLDCAPAAAQLGDLHKLRLDAEKLDLVGIKDTLGARVFPGWTFGAAITLACLLLFLGATGKSAQLPLYAWLPDAMAGPTPVSALIHAATMVTAGVYMVARLRPLFDLSPFALEVVALVGALTALFAALIALTQTDIKKVLAYSTISQLGYMFLAAGVGAYGLAMFHVVTHAFFKGLLFLGAGSVIHALAGEQDLTKMGGLRAKMPVSFWTMLIGALALAGFPLTAGWYSKDAILESVLAAGGRLPLAYVLYVLALASAFCTALYAFRLIALAFLSPSRLAPVLPSLPSSVASQSASVSLSGSTVSLPDSHSDSDPDPDPRAPQSPAPSPQPPVPSPRSSRLAPDAHPHESPRVMTWPLMVLAAGALTAGALGQALLLNGLGRPAAHESAVHGANLLLTTLASLGGIGAALFLYVKQSRVPRPDGPRRFLAALAWHKFYVDDFYDRVVARAFALGAEALHLLVEVLLIDTLLVAGTAFVAKTCGRGLRVLQSGLLNAYALGMLGGALVLLYWLLR